MKWRALLENAIQEKSQAEVARRLGYSSSALSQVRKGTYKGSTAKLATKVIEVYGNVEVTCPVLGKIGLARCAVERKTPFSTSNPIRVQLHQACRDCMVPKDN